MEQVFILSAARTPIGCFCGALASVSAPRLGAIALKEALKRATVDPGKVDEVYLGNVITAGEGQAPANQASIYAGLSTHTPCTTVNKVCASGMKAIMLGAQSIQLGDNSLVAAGGMESMSNVPYYLPKARQGYRLGHGKVIDGILTDGLWDPYNDFHMGNAAEICAAQYKLSREDQDAFAAESYRRVAQAYEKGFYQREIVPVPLEGKSTTVVREDEEYRRVDFEKMKTLRPAFQQGGTITAANASKINDGAAALILASAAQVRALGVTPLAEIISFADASQDPEWFTTTPSLAMGRALAKADLRITEMDYAEINEAFSCVTMANSRDLGLAPERVNAWGGAVALGHPVGCSGARIIVTLCHILKANQARYGIAGICNGGGGASAMVIRRV